MLYYVHSFIPPEREWSEGRQKRSSSESEVWRGGHSVTARVWLFLTLTHCPLVIWSWWRTGGWWRSDARERGRGRGDQHRGQTIDCFLSNSFSACPRWGRVCQHTGRHQEGWSLKGDKGQETNHTKMKSLPVAKPHISCMVKGDHTYMSPWDILPFEYCSKLTMMYNWTDIV